jgi:hypothetical protein
MSKQLQEEGGVPTGGAVPTPEPPQTKGVRSLSAGPRDKFVYLAVSPRVARMIKTALIVDNEGPRSDDRSGDDIAIIEQVIYELDGQIKGT